MSRDMVHIIDSPYYRHIYGSEEMEAVFNAMKRYQRWLDIEAALARVQAGLGVIPQEAAKEISRKAKVDLLDHDFIREQLAATGHSLMPVLKAVQKICDNGYGEYIHYGPTTQDIQDTTSVLELRDAFHIIARHLLHTEELLLPLAKKYAAFPMAGRTHNQQGLPITLGLKFANWCAEIRRDIERLKDLKKRLFIIMLHGGTGTMAGLGERAYETVKGVAKELGLQVPPTGWGSARDNFAEYESVLGIICGTTSRICNEIYQLSRTEIGELTESFPSDYVGSSTMAHKRNAERCSMNVGICRIVMNNSLLGLQAMMSEHERDTRAWRLDWHSLAESSVLTARALTTMNEILADLAIYEDRITSNLDFLKGLLFSEAIMFHLGRKLGKLTAHEVVHEAANRVQTKGDVDFKTALLEDKNVAGKITLEELEELMNYDRHIGTSIEQVEHVAATAKELSATDKTLFE